MERIYSEHERNPVPLVTRLPGNRGKQERKKKEEETNSKEEKKLEPLLKSDISSTEQTENELDPDSSSKGLKVDIQV
jgi:hypothetical protein